jgi:tetratricopeptide (TPR) repeat protein
MSRSLRLAVAALSIACGTAPAVPKSAPLESAEDRLARANQLADAAPGDLVLQTRTGWLDYLIGSDPEAALRRFELVLAKNNGAPPEQRALALAGRGEIFEDRLQILAGAQAYADAVQADPSSPIAELAAERLLEAEGDSRAVDDLILDTAAKLGHGTQGRAAHFLREAVAHVANSRSFAGGAISESDAWAVVGAVQRFRVAGPYAAERLLDLNLPTALDGKDLAAAPATGPAGNTAERNLEFPDGDVGLELEPGEGDLFYAASDLALSRGGDYLLMIEGAGAVEARLDGVVAISRAPWPREQPRAQLQAVRLEQGKHSLLVRWSRAEGPRFRITLLRADGDASDLRSDFPERLRARRLSSSCALGVACLPAAAFVDDGSLRGAATRMLDKDPADTLAAFLLARSTLKDDRDAAKAAIDRLVVLTGKSAPALAMRVVQVLTDGDIPERIGHALAIADLSAAVEKDPRMLRASLTLAAMQRDAERTEEAANILTRTETKARAMLGNGDPLPSRLVMARARLLEAQGNLAVARTLAEMVRVRDAGRCDGLGMAQELSKREGSLADQKSLSEALLVCPEQRGVLPTQLRERGDLAGSEAMLAKFVALRPAQPQRLAQLAEAQATRGNLQQAIATLQRAVELAPRASDPWRQIAAWRDLSGDKKGALEARQVALARLPGDILLRRQIALARGEKLMGWSDRDGLAIAHETAITPPADDGGERPAALRLLDYGGVEFGEDGSAVERVHTLVRILDKTGIGRFGEVTIPADADILELRNIKPDGRTLEPEAIPEKDTHSIPGLEPGDAIETDYLRAYSARGPELPGISLGAFFFADDTTPMLESTYEARAPRTLPLEVDARHLPPQKIDKSVDGQRYSHSETRIPSVRQEPNQPSEEEIAPWVQLGYGARPDGVARSIADWLLLRARPTIATDALADKAGGQSTREKIERIIGAVCAQVRGRSNTTDFSSPAQQVLAMGRGNRLMVVKAALASAGIHSHFVLVKPFGALTDDTRFPRGDLFSFTVLRIDEQPGLGQPIWYDATWRLGPIDQLPPFARGQEALVLAEPGEAASSQRIKTPGSGATGEDGRTLSLELTLNANGEATGKGHDEALGFEAASLREALEQLDAPARRQAVEQMLARALPGAALESVTVAGENAQGGKSSLDYVLRAQLGRVDGAEMRVPSTLLPAGLSRRYAELAERKKPLLLQSLERYTVHAAIALAAGQHLRAPPEATSLQTPFGRYRWSAKEVAGKLILEEELLMPPQRIAPADYPAFVAFTRQVDQVQGRELLLSP